MIKIHVFFAILIIATVPAGPHCMAAARGKDAAGTSVGAILPSTPPADAVILQPGDDAATKVNEAPAHTTFYFNAGTFRLVSITPKDGDIFIGASGAVLSGAKLIASFGRSGSYYTADRQKQNGNGPGFCDPEHPECTHTSDLFIDNVPLTQVNALSLVTSGKFYFDHTNYTIYLADDPSGHTVETSSIPAAFNGSARGVRIQNLVVEKYASPAQQGAINCQGSAWLLDHLEVTLNHGYGARLTAGSVIQYSYVHDNGEMGIGGGGTSGLVAQYNQLSGNNYAGYNCDWECGGAKWGAVSHSIFRSNFVTANLGKNAVGLWCDVGCSDITFGNNLVTNNPGAGILYEISCFGAFTNNISTGNGFGSAGWYWGGGIQISASHDVVITGSTLIDNFNGITGVNQNRGAQSPCGDTIISNMRVENNSTTTSARSNSAAALVTDAGFDEIFSAANNNHYENNTYRLNPRTKTWFAWKGESDTVDQWKSAGNDKSGIFLP